MSLWIVFDNSEDWLTDVISADGEWDAYHKSADLHQNRVPWGAISAEEDGTKYTTLSILEWHDQSVSALDYYSRHESNGRTVYVTEPSSDGAKCCRCPATSNLLPLDNGEYICEDCAQVMSDMGNESA